MIGVKSENAYLSLVAALAIGVAQYFLLQLFWAAFATSFSLVPWFVAHGTTGVSLRVAFFFIDNSLNLLLSLPAAFVLRTLRPYKVLVYLALAVVPALLWEYRLVFSDPSFFLEHWRMFLPGFLVAVFILPLAVLVSSVLARRRGESVPGAVA